jgi:hypothetical protein
MSAQNYEDSPFTPAATVEARSDRENGSDYFTPHRRTATIPFSVSHLGLPRYTNPKPGRTTRAAVPNPLPLLRFSRTASVPEHHLENGRG